MHPPRLRLESFDTQGSVTHVVASVCPGRHRRGGPDWLGMGWRLGFLVNVGHYEAQIKDRKRVKSCVRPGSSQSKGISGYRIQWGIPLSGPGVRCFFHGHTCISEGLFPETACTGIFPSSRLSTMLLPADKRGNWFQTLALETASLV